MKIKQEKRLTLPQLIEWLGKNRRFGETFTSDRYHYVHVNVDGVLKFVGDFYEDIFTVEVEEEITENTVFKQIFETDMEGFDEGFENVSINDVLSPRTESLVVMDKHLEPVTIWTNTEGLVKKDVII